LQCDLPIVLVNVEEAALCAFGGGSLGLVDLRCDPVNVENARKRQAAQSASNDFDAIIHALLYQLADIDPMKTLTKE
jgi:hypothetical protein